MINYIWNQASKIEDDLWDFAKSHYGLDRNEESVGKIQLLFEKAIREGAGQLLAIKNQTVADNEIHQSHTEDENLELLSLALLAVGMTYGETEIDAAFDMLTVAISAATLARVVPEISLSQSKLDASTAGKSLADIKNRNIQIAIDDIIKMWKEHCPRNESASKAAEKLIRMGVDTFSHRKMAEIISAEKKKRPQ